MSFKELFNLNLAIVNYGGLLKYIIRRTKNPGSNKILRQNIRLGDSKKSDTCYICALGPSLKEVDFSVLEGDTMVVNAFVLLGKEYPDFVPTYYMFADKGFAKEKHLWKFKSALETYIPKKTKFILDVGLKGNEALNPYPENQIYFMNNGKGLFYSNKKIKLDSINPAFGNVACVAIAYAIALGYKKIVLLGCDFNSFAQTTQAHCYKDTTAKRQISFDFELFNYSFDANMHMQLAEYARNHGIEIINSTKGSLIDAYPVEIDEKLYRHD